MHVLYLHVILPALFLHVSSTPDCWHYTSIETKEDYEEFVHDCEGAGKLGFENDHPWIFNASMVTEKQFNKLFKKAYRLRMSIFIQNTDFKKPNLKALKKIHVRKGIPSFRIENNPNLVELRLPATAVQAKPDGSTIELYYYANGDSDPSQVRTLCNKDETCHYAKDTECSRIEHPIKLTKPHRVDEFVNQCQGQKVIKAIPGVKLELNLAMLSAHQIKRLFKNVEELYMCITAVGTYHKRVMFPKLKHLEACEGGENSLELVNNPFLRELVLPVSFTSDQSIRVRGNPVLSHLNIRPLVLLCPMCDVQDPGEERIDTPNDFQAVCENYAAPKNENDYLALVYRCAGVKKLFFTGNKVETFDASMLEQRRFEELFKSIEETNFCIRVFNTGYTRLALPNLRKVRHKRPGCVLDVQNNAFMRDLLIHYEVHKEGSLKLTATLKNNKVITPQFTSRWRRRLCKDLTCELSAYTDCFNLEDIGAKKIAQECKGKKVIKPAPGAELHVNVADLTVDEFFDLFEHVEEAHMCLKAHNTNHEELSFPQLKKLVACNDAEPAIDVKNNKKLAHMSFNKNLKLPSSTIVRGNPKLSTYDLKKMRKQCSGCNIQKDKEKSA